LSEEKFYKQPKRKTELGLDVSPMKEKAEELKNEIIHFRNETEEELL